MTDKSSVTRVALVRVNLYAASGDGNPSSLGLPMVVPERRWPAQTLISVAEAHRPWPSGPYPLLAGASVAAVTEPPPP